MQSGYGVSEIPQFLVDGLCSPLFPSTTDQHPAPHHPQNSTPTTTTPTPSPFHLYHLQQQQQQQQQQHLQQFYHHHLQPPPPPPPPPPQHQQQFEAAAAAARFVHFHPIPITQQFFEQQQQQQTTSHQLHLFDQQRRGLHAHLGLDDDSPPPPTSASPAPPPFMSFRLAVNGSGGGGGASRDGLNDDDGGLLPADDEACESRINLWAAPPPPQPREEETAIKEPFWRPLDIDYMNRNNKRCKENEAAMLEQSSPKQHLKETKELVVPESEETTNSATNYKLFSELEAICKPGGTSAAAATAVVNNNNNNNNPTGSSSALTGDNPCAAAAAAPVAPNCTEFPADHASNASTGDEEGSLKKGHSTTSSKARRRRRRRQQLSSIAAFFESLVKQLMDHQEALHRRFLEILENRDQERERKEQQWREQEAAKSADDARARAEQQAASAARETAIVSFLEKITGQPLNLPTRAQFEIEDIINKQANNNNNNATTEGSDENRAATAMNSNRWPKVEVQALIKVRSGLESRFQEPGLKGPLWEEVSSIMGAMGYRRSAKRCKEKWENINKYFRKTKESNRKRPQHSKTCPYFQQLDQLYSKSHNNETPMEVDRRGNSELLDAIVVHTDQTGARSDPEANAREDERRENEEDDEGHEEDEEEEEGEEEGEGETQGVAQWSQPNQEEEESQLSSHEHTTNLFFHTLQS